MIIRRLVGLNVRRLRLGRKPQLSQQKLAAEARISLTYMSGIERGKQSPSIDVVVRLAKALGVSIEVFVAPIPPGYVPPKNLPRGPNVHHKGRRVKPRK